MDNYIVKIIANLFDQSYGSSYAGNIYDSNYNAPTLMTTHGGGWGCLILDYGDSNE